MRKNFWQKTIFALLFACILNSAFFAVEIEWDRIPRGGAELKARVFVKDCGGNPVEGAAVMGHFVVYYKGTFVNDVVLTDADGYAVVHGNSDDYDYQLFVTKKGWYDSDDSSKSALNPFMGKQIGVKAGKWFPYAQKHEIVLKEIRKPIPMVCFRRVFLETPEPDKEYGYDLEYGSLVEPYGDGKVADFYVKHTYVESEERLFRTVTITFPNALDGAYICHLDMESMFPSPYHADVEAEYLKEFSFDGYLKKFNGHISGKDAYRGGLEKNQGMVLRTRTAVDGNGTLVSAHYSKIYGSFSPCCIEYACLGEELTIFFNPMENDTNLEFDNKYYPVQKGKNSPSGLLEKW